MGHNWKMKTHFQLALLFVCALMGAFGSRMIRLTASPRSCCSLPNNADGSFERVFISHILSKTEGKTLLLNLSSSLSWLDIRSGFIFLLKPKIHSFPKLIVHQLNCVWESSTVQISRVCAGKLIYKLIPNRSSMFEMLARNQITAGGLISEYFKGYFRKWLYPSFMGNSADSSSFASDLQWRLFIICSVGEAFLFLWSIKTLEILVRSNFFNNAEVEINNGCFFPCRTTI